jgi:hypothetical protein
MGRLRHRDLCTLLAYLRTCYAACDLVGFPKNILAGLSDIVPSDWVWHNRANPSGHRIELEPPRQPSGDSVEFGLKSA